MNISRHDLFAGLAMHALVTNYRTDDAEAAETIDDVDRRYTEPSCPALDNDQEIDYISETARRIADAMVGESEIVNAHSHGSQNSD